MADDKITYFHKIGYYLEENRIVFYIVMECISTLRLCPENTAACI